MRDHSWPETLGRHCPAGRIVFYNPRHSSWGRGWGDWRPRIPVAQGVTLNVSRSRSNPARQQENRIMVPPPNSRDWCEIQRELKRYEVVGRSLLQPNARVFLLLSHLDPGRQVPSWHTRMMYLRICVVGAELQEGS